MMKFVATDEILEHSRRIMNIKFFVCSSVIACLIGCSTVPTAGPTTSQVLDQLAQKGSSNLTLVNVNEQVVDALASEPDSWRNPWLNDRGKPPEAKIGVGDTLSIMIWDSSSGGLLGGGPADTATGGVAAGGGNAGIRNVTVPDQVVGPDGTVSVPYAGRVQVSNRTPQQVEKAIRGLLAKSAYDPQVVVTIPKSVSRSVTISGESMSGARVPLSVRGDRILDVIGAAGGTKTSPYETTVRLTRNGVTAVMPMSKLVSDPSKNIYAWPGDVITLVKAPETFTVFGATLNNSQIPFGADQINLAQAIAKAGGLQDARADPSGVFLFRFEPRSVVSAMKVPSVPTTPSGEVPVVYHLDLHDVSSYFMARRFAMRDNDIIYAANASMTDLQKFFTLVGTISSPVIGGVVVTKATGY
jgi:polysaccharide export outer membrane protein